jgi:hypothetical protein
VSLDFAFDNQTALMPAEIRRLTMQLKWGAHAASRAVFRAPTEKTKALDD